MESLLLGVNIIIAVLLVISILLQKSEGGALGIGVSQENFMLSRSAGSFMTKATAIVATLFIICSYVTLVFLLFLRESLLLLQDHLQFLLLSQLIVRL